MVKRRKTFLLLLLSVIPSIFIIIQVFKKDPLTLPLENLISANFHPDPPSNHTNYEEKTEIFPEIEKTPTVAFVVLMKDKANIAEYEFAQKTIKCYCESRNIPYYLIVNDVENTRNCRMQDYMYQRHCILAEFMNKTDHDWFVMLDADMGVVNPNSSIDRFIPKNESVFLVLTNRVMNSEIMTGSYIIRNDPRGREFLMMWAHSIEAYEGRFGSDNAAVHSAMIRKYLPELETELSKCEYWWKLAEQYCRLFLYEVCVRDLLDKHRIPGIKFLKKSYSYVRDGWLTGGRFSDEDFIFHNWKQKVKNNRGAFGWWDYQFVEKAFGNLSLCESSTEASSLWLYRPGFRVKVAENRKKLDGWVLRTWRERQRQLKLAKTFNINETANCK